MLTAILFNLLQRIDVSTLIKKIYDGKIISLSVVSTTLPNNAEVDLEIIDHPGGAAVVAVDDKNQICLLKQYRYAFDEWLWELPAGKIDDCEPPQQTAIRELTEEAGVIAAHWQNLGKFISSPGVFRECVYLFMAKGLTHTDHQQAEDEVIEIHWLPFDQAVAWVMKGDIKDGKSALAILKAYQRMQSDD